MKDVEKLRELYIVKEKNDFSEKNTNRVDYQKWVEFVEKNKETYTWLEDTQKGKNLLKNIDSIPNDFRDSFVSLLKKVRCFYNYRNTEYDYSIGFSEQSDKVMISFEKKITHKELKSFLDMANYLDALLLIDEKTVIDQQFIEELERKQ